MIEQILQADRYLNVDQVDKARAIYQRVVELDPRNAIGMVGLARCALADGDDERAYELAAEALTIDPENDMARRMEARLSEILSARGIEVTRPSASATAPARDMRPVVAGATALEPSSTPSATAMKPSSAASATAVESSSTAGSRTGGAPPSAPPTAARKSLLDRLLGR